MNTHMNLVTSHDDLLQAIEAGIKLENMTFQGQFSAEQVERVRLEAREAGKVEAEEEWKAERARLVNAAIDGESPDVRAASVAAERKRILGIQATMVNGFEKLGQEAIENGMSEEEFAVVVLREVRDRGITLDGIRRDAPPAAAFAKCPDPEHPPMKKPNSSTDKNAVFERRAQQAEAARTRSR